MQGKKKVCVTFCIGKSHCTQKSGCVNIFLNRKFLPLSKVPHFFLKHDFRNSWLQKNIFTNPIFPSIATESRIRWAGLEPEDFELYTTYENTGYCKPNPDYYRDILNKLNIQPEDCLMVGNDVTEDMIAASVGTDVFLLTDCMINREQKDISVYPHGSFEQLLAYLREK